VKQPARPLLVLHGDPTVRDRLRALTDAGYGYEEYADWAALSAGVHDAPASAVVVVDPYFPKGGLAAELRELLFRYPSTPVTAALEVTADRATDLWTLGKWGICEIISVHHDDTKEAILTRVRSTHARKLREAIAAILPPETGGRARAIVDTAAELVASGADSSKNLAVALQVSRRTLLRWTVLAGLPPPRKLLAWVRILMAAQRLDDPDQTVLDVARAAGYGGDGALRRVTAKLVGLSPGAMRRRGAFAAAGARFREALVKHGRLHLTSQGDSPAAASIC
jgi:AraC-like DNA-binding protein